ncbi:NADH dehydrogenase [ubiquinone] 1 alpha subcomplex subunit 6 [Planococcus citri]|uniref:NADH dehydrogenase [ubiquinone] 1 alpha subcomplex subunit 6 n=1 Tax=Planococcus citri TaxID=170843 RepID=UPI0031F8EFCC
MSSKAGSLVRPLLSSNRQEARLKALRLYRLWYRYIPWIKHNMMHGLPITQQEMREKLRQEFYKNKDITDVRVIDMLIFHGRNDLREIGELWAQPCHVMGEHFKDTVNPVPTKFLDKFFSSPD